MSDGVALAADLYLERKPGTKGFEARPVVLVRTPYNKAYVSTRFDFRPFIDGGYAVVFQDVRGTSASGGTLEPMMNESRDGADTIAWLIAQPWCNGQVGTTGPSYMGGVQLQLAVRPVPGHETAFIQVPAGNMFGGSMVYDNDMLALETCAPWTMMMAASLLDRFPAETAAAIRNDIEANNLPLPVMLAGDQLSELVRPHDLRSLPVARHVPFWHAWLDNRENPDFFAAAEANSKFGDVTRPLMHFSGWYDLFLRNSLEAYVEISAKGATPAARSGQRLIIGPWGHRADPGFRQFPDSEVNDAAASAAWMNLHLRGKAHPLFDHPVILYVMGENRWRAESAWPCPGAVRTVYYLHSNGGANGAQGDGTLSITVPATDEPADHYLFDPANPLKSLGGHGVTGGPVDQQPNEHRKDLLIYATEPLDEDVEVTGQVRATLYAASSATDTDWFVKLIDVFPDGRSYNILTGSARGRYRKSRTAPVELVPGEVVAYEIDMWSTSNVFKKGHRIRVEIASSDFPNADLNPNRFMDLSTATAADYVIAEQTIFHDSARPSSIELPIIPLDRSRKWIDTPFPANPGGHYYGKLEDTEWAFQAQEMEASQLRVP
nr:CocE/NonD family hydrolase [Sphingomonas tagetis]